MHNSLTQQIPHNQPKKRGHFICAPTNSGKTTAALHHFIENKPYYMKDVHTGTFDDYNGESICLIDDLNPRSPVLPILKNLLNVARPRVNIKFGSLF